MTNPQKAALKSICQFILDVYAPMFFSIYTQPSAEGPALVLLNRDLMKSTQPQIVKHTKSCFLKHVETWLLPKTVALSCHSENPPVQIEDMSKISTPSVDTKHLLLEQSPTSCFFQYYKPMFSLSVFSTAKRFKSFQK